MAVVGRRQLGLDMPMSSRKRYAADIGNQGMHDSNGSNADYQSPEQGARC